jgi:arylsulfatase A-like enzyme
VSQRRKRAFAVVAAVGTVLMIIASLGVLSLATPGSPALASDAAAGAQETGSTLLAAGPPVDIEPVLPEEPAAEPAATMDDIENVVVILADDMDWALFDGVPRLAALKEKGTTLTNFVVTDSLCCPSRASILRGQYVHNHGVLSNSPATGGGWLTFRDNGLEEDCVGTWLQDAGVSTALVGKYLNGYGKAPRTKRHLPPGWDHFVTSTSNRAYAGYDYELNRNGVLAKYADDPEDFLNDVLTADATTWLSETDEPFFLLFSSYNPHVPAPASDKNTGSHAGATVPKTGAFNARGIGEPSWLRKTPALTAKGIARLDRLWTRRLESAESIADSYEAIVAELERSGRLDSTLIVVTSDNGYHAGARRLPTGKQTPFWEDSVVPAVLIGPGVPQGQTIDAMTSTIDLGPTLADLLDANVPSWADGRSLVPLLEDPDGFPWRTGVLLESLSKALPGDPDYTGFDAPVFRALRTAGWLYVEYSGGEVGLYDRVNDPAEINNVVSRTSPLVVAQLRSQLRALVACAGPSCRTADMRNAPSPVARTEASPVG